LLHAEHAAGVHSATVTYYISIPRHAVVNVFPIGAITRDRQGRGAGGDQLDGGGGAVAISDDGMPVMNSRVMRRADGDARALEDPIINHCEDLNLSNDGDMHECLDRCGWAWRGFRARRDVMVARDILLAELTGARYHVAHISTRHAVQMVAYAKHRACR